MEREFKKRDMALTEFGETTGIDLDEVAVFLAKQTRNTKNKIWTKYIIKKNETILKKNIYKILFALTYATLKRKKKRGAKKPPQLIIKKLTNKLYRKLPRKKRKHVLEKQDFIQNFARYLFEIHNEWVEN